jgi:GT2 family glycosyltransferase
MEIAKGKYTLILDADTEFIENSIKHLYDYMEEHFDCGIIGSKLIDSNMNLQYTCKRFPTFFSLIFRRLDRFKVVSESNTLKKHIMMDWDHSEVKDVDYLIGACQFIRREVIDKIGYYDTNIFYGPEDIDYCLRVWKAGWKVIYYPHTKIIHHEQRITKKNIFSDISLRHFKGILYIYRKYNGRIKV